MINVSEKFAEKFKPHILCSMTFFPKIADNMIKHGTAGQATDDNIKHGTAGQATDDNIKHATAGQAMDDNIKHATAGQATDDSIIWRTRFACWITKATDTHSEYVILIAFPLLPWLRERTSLYVCTYTARLVVSCFSQQTVNYFPTQRQLLGLYNRDEVCLLRGTN
jgi:hypothetical protein